MKCVIVIDRTLPNGLAANTAAVLSISLGAQLSDIVGSDVFDADGGRHPGLMHIPIPILCSEEGGIRAIKEIAMEKEAMGLHHVAVTDIAQRSKNYSSYVADMSQSNPARLKYLGVALYGDRALVTSITGDLPLYR